jgi:hypothetical protein
MNSTPRHRPTWPWAPVLVLLALLTAGCSGATTPGPAPTTSPGPGATSSPAPSPTSSELTAEQDLAVNPPPPDEVVAETEDKQVVLTWLAPPAVTVPHRYSDRVVGYRIYRQGPEELEPSPVATVTQLRYTERPPAPGAYRYLVSSIREGDLEGTRSDPASVTVR